MSCVKRVCVCVRVRVRVREVYVCGYYVLFVIMFVSSYE